MLRAHGVTNEEQVGKARSLRDQDEPRDRREQISSCNAAERKRFGKALHRHLTQEPGPTRDSYCVFGHLYYLCAERSPGHSPRLPIGNSLRAVKRNRLADSKRVVSRASDGSVQRPLTLDGGL